MKKSLKQAEYIISIPQIQIDRYLLLIFWRWRRRWRERLSKLTSGLEPGRSFLPGFILICCGNTADSTRFFCSKSVKRNNHKMQSWFAIGLFYRIVLGFQWSKIIYGFNSIESILLIRLRWPTMTWFISHNTFKFEIQVYFFRTKIVLFLKIIILHSSNLMCVFFLLLRIGFSNCTCNNFYRQAKKQMRRSYTTTLQALAVRLLATGTIEQQFQKKLQQ